MSGTANPYRAAGTFTGATYTERQADRDLLRVIQQNQRFPYVLAPRQTGKSSLITHVRAMLRAPEFRTAFVDFSIFKPEEAANLDAFQARFFDECRRSLHLSEPLPACERFLDGMDQLLAHCPGARLVVFLDEVDALLPAPFKDTFFSILRNVFNERATRPELKRVQFVLAGAARPEELITDRLRSPFNVGEAIILNELSVRETALTCALMAGRLGVPAAKLAEAVFAHAGGSVYLTQLILQRLWDSAVPNDAVPSSSDVPGTLSPGGGEGEVPGSASAVQFEEEVRRIAAEIVAGAPHDIHFENIRASLCNRPEALLVYRRLLSRRAVSVPERELLWFTGLAPREGPAIYRNRIYEQVFHTGGPLDQATPWWQRRRARQMAARVVSITALLGVTFFGAIRWEHHRVLSWAATQVELGDALCDQAARTNAHASSRLLGDAVAAYRGALSVYAREDHPRQWAAAQNNLGAALRSQAKVSSGGEAARLLIEAVAACREALKLYTREQFPQEWGSAQNNLGNALNDQAGLSPGPEAARLMAEAVAAYRKALTVRTREQSPQEWAQRQSNLGSALRDQAGLSTGDEAARLLTNAVAAFREALTVQSSDRFPQDWAMTQNNLGIALWDQAKRSEGVAAMRLLTEAVAAFRAALDINKREQLLAQWAAAQSNLGNALRDQAARSEDAEAAQLLADAVAAYGEALKIYTREQYPRQWAMAQNNLGLALRDQAGFREGPEAAVLLGKAVTAYREALTVYAREQSPQDWATAKYNLGAALRDQASLSTGIDAARLLSGAVEAYRESLIVFTRDGFPQQWAASQNNLGNALRDQAAVSDDAEARRLLTEAVAAYNGALIVWTQQSFPDYYALAQGNLAKAEEALRKLRP